MAFTPASVTADISYGLGLLSSFNAKVDVVGIYSGDGATFGQMFARARPMRANVRETSRVMEHPVETGATIADHHIINPVEIELPMLIASQDYASTYTQIRQAFVNATPLSVKTRTGIYKNMIIAEMPHEEDAEMYDVITMGLRLRQVLFFLAGTNQLADNFQPVDATNSNTISSGLQSGFAISNQLLNAATAAASYANFFSRI